MVSSYPLRRFITSYPFLKAALTIATTLFLYASPVMHGSMQSVVTGGTTTQTPRGGPNLWGFGLRATVPPSRVHKKRNQTGYYPPQRKVITLAKDGTMRGGPRTGSGRKSKALAEKLEAGNPGGRTLTVMELPDTTDLNGADMPEPKSYMSDRQKNGEEFDAVEVFQETWKWLQERGCEQLVSAQLIRNYAMSVSRWIQCERALSEYGFLAKHPTTGAAIASPYVSMSQNYMKQVNNLWYQIFQIVKENCAAEFSGSTPQDDVMERLLRTRKGM